MVAKHGPIPRRFRRRYRRSKCGACYRRLLKVPWTEKNNKDIIQMADVGERLLQHFMKRKLGYFRTHNERQLGTFATTIPRGEHRREERTMERHGCQPADR
ncbi:hypothetical protein ElyMa_005347700 [Elysia marginata]|uniref:60S ribosomal protein L34 n=1 Tax=Elysia marginata TaxID=1093978 RepID=A0AAV4EAX0_9GAST|nr:hypothetical protein ElyMa_005347700 [Elysia marginata]